MLHSFSKFTDNILAFSQTKKFPLATLIFAIVFLLFWHHLSEIPPDTGDGLEHFFIAQAALEHGRFFLDHWGKPLFVLFASPWTLLGFSGIVYFNISVFIASILLMYSCLRFFKIPEFVLAVFPILLLSVHDYSYTLLSGLTEPLFSLITLICFYAIVKKKWALLAIITSFAPFSRSEGMLLIPLIFLILIFHKKWKFTPLLGLGFLIYAFIGEFILGDFLWYFNDNPYVGAENIYGSGTWFHYLENITMYLGALGVILGLLATINFLKTLRNYNFSEALSLAFGLVLLPFIVLVHAYLWYHGERGAFGLSRLGTHGLPLFLMCSTIILFKASQSILSKIQLNSFSHAVLVIAFINMLLLPFPTFAANLNRNCFEAGNYYKSKQSSFNKVYFLHPMFAFSAGINPYRNSENLKQFRTSNFKKIASTMFSHGDVIVRDSHFGPLEMGISIEDIKSIDQFVKVKSFASDLPYRTKFGELLKVDFYQYNESTHTYSPKVESVSIDLSFDEMDENSGKEYIDFLKELSFEGRKSDNTFIHVKFDCRFPIENEFWLILANEQTKYKQQQQIKTGKNHIVFPIVANDGSIQKYSMFIHNVQKVSGVFEDVQAEIEFVTYPEPFFNQKNKEGEPN